MSSSIHLQVTAVLPAPIWPSPPDLTPRFAAISSRSCFWGLHSTFYSSRPAACDLKGPSFFWPDPISRS